MSSQREIEQLSQQLVMLEKDAELEQLRGKEKVGDKRREIESAARCSSEETGES